MQKMLKSYFLNFLKVIQCATNIFFQIKSFVQNEILKDEWFWQNKKKAWKNNFFSSLHSYLVHL